MPDAREWHELAEDVPELRPTKRGGRRYLICNADVEDWWWCGGEDQALREDTDVAHALCRERAVKWLGERGWSVGTYHALWYVYREDEAYRERASDIPDFDVALRLAVDAVHASQKGD
jgi:hypothetical protein